MNIGIAELFLFPIWFAIPAIILYFLIKTAVKRAITELKKEGVI